MRSAGFEPAIPSLGSSYLNQAGLTSLAFTDGEFGIVSYHRTSPVASVVRKKWQQFWAGSQVSSYVRFMRCRTTPDPQIYRGPRLSFFQPLRRSLVAFFHSGYHSVLYRACQPEHSLASFYSSVAMLAKKHAGGTAFIHLPR